MEVENNMKKLRVVFDTQGILNKFISLFGFLKIIMDIRHCYIHIILKREMKI